METVHTFCRICSSYCGIDVTVGADGRIERIGPDKLNPYTWRDFCAKGRTAAQLVEHPRRLLTPMKRVGDRYVEASWDEAISSIATGLRRIIDRDGPDAVGVYWGNPAGYSGTHPTFVTAFMDAIGTRNRYFVGSVDQNNYHVVAEAMFGSQLMVLAPDVDPCMCFLLVGMNPAVSGFDWMSGVVPHGWKRTLDAQARGATVIVVDPVRTATAQRADVHVAIRPGQDWAFLLAAIKVVLDESLEDRAACAALTGYDALVALCRDADLDDLAARCEIPVETIADVARRFSTAPTAFCVAHTGVAQNPTGTIGDWLGMALNAVTGRLDRPGGRRYERGYVDSIGMFEKFAKRIEGVSRVRGVAPAAGHFPQAILAEEITTPGKGQVRAMIIDAGNPVVSGPNGKHLDEALSSLELLVAVDLVQRESHRWAHWLIPSVHYLERDDLLTLISQALDAPYVQFGPKAVDPPPGARQEWEFFTDLALTMKVPLFGHRGINSVIRASRWLAKRTKLQWLAFDPMWMQRALVVAGRRIKWKDIMAHPHGWIFDEKRYGDFPNALRTNDKRVHVAPPIFVTETRRQLMAPPAPPSVEFPLLLVNQRHRDSMNSWLNELPGLHRRHRHNDIKIHPEDAAALGISTGDHVRVSSPAGSFDSVACVSDAPRRGVVISAHGWGSGVYAPASTEAPLSLGVNRNVVVDEHVLDPLSGIPALNSTAVRIDRRAP